jgi:hypothetical protein
VCVAILDAFLVEAAGVRGASLLEWKERSMSMILLALAFVAPAAPATQHPAYCVVQGEKLVPTSQVSAEKLDWFLKDDPVAFGKKKYVKYGFPQIMGIDDLAFWTTKDSVPVMVRADAGDYRGVVYVQSSTSVCEFQPYRMVGKP